MFQSLKPVTSVSTKAEVLNVIYETYTYVSPFSTTYTFCHLTCPLLIPKTKDNGGPRSGI